MRTHARAACEERCLRPARRDWLPGACEERCLRPGGGRCFQAASERPACGERCLRGACRQACLLRRSDQQERVLRSRRRSKMESACGDGRSGLRAPALLRMMAFPLTRHALPPCWTRGGAANKALFIIRCDRLVKVRKLEGPFPRRLLLLPIDAGTSPTSANPGPARCRTASATARPAETAWSAQATRSAGASEGCRIRTGWCGQAGQAGWGRGEEGYWGEE